jgi:GTP-binding protein
MNNRRAAFMISAADVNGCPHPRVPEYAFFGRSNVGKSSLINMISGVKNLARTSSTPGKTQLLIHGTWLIFPDMGMQKFRKNTGETGRS